MTLRCSTDIAQTSALFRDKTELRLFLSITRSDKISPDLTDRNSCHWSLESLQRSLLKPNKFKILSLVRRCLRFFIASERLACYCARSVSPHYYVQCCGPYQGSVARPFLGCARENDQSHSLGLCQWKLCHNNSVQCSVCRSYTSNYSSSASALLPRRES